MPLSAIVYDLLNYCNNLDNLSIHLVFYEETLLSLLKLHFFYVRYIWERQTVIISDSLLMSAFQNLTSDTSEFNSEG